MSFIIPLLLIFAFNVCDCVKENSELIAVVQVFRHGLRTPIYFYPTDPYSNRSNWPVNNGQLTNKGKMQLYNLGKYTRERYNDFLSTTYNYEDLYVQTTDVDRTHMSAQAFLAGLYTPTPAQQWNPDLKWQPIPVHPMDRRIFTAGPGCSSYKINVADVMTNDVLYEHINEMYSEVYKYISIHSGINVTTVAEPSDIYDMLHIEDIYGKRLPEWTVRVYPRPMRTLREYWFRALGYNDKLKRLGVGLWLHTIIDYFDKFIKDPSSNRKYQVFSGHDNNIAVILSTFGVTKLNDPDFASTIYVELRKSNTQGYVINVWSRNGVDDIEAVTIKGCDFDCKLDDFKEIMKPWNVDADTWEKECDATTDIKSGVHLENIRLWLENWSKRKHNRLYKF